MRHIFASLFLAAAVSAPPAIAQTDTDARPSAECASSGPESVADRHRKWILVGWEKRPGDGAFDFRRKLGHFYEWESSKVRLYDDFDPQFRVARSAGEYGSFWTEPFTALRSARHRVMDEPDAIVGSDLATLTLEFAARLEAADGAVTGIRTRSSLVWHCTADGWKIAREHNSSRRVSRQEIDAILPPL